MNKDFFVEKAVKDHFSLKYSKYKFKVDHDWFFFNKKQTWFACRFKEGFIEGRVLDSECDLNKCDHDLNFSFRCYEDFYAFLVGSDHVKRKTLENGSIRLIETTGEKIIYRTRYLKKLEEMALVAGYSVMWQGFTFMNVLPSVTYQKSKTKFLVSVAPFGRQHQNGADAWAEMKWALYVNGELIEEFIHKEPFKDAFLAHLVRCSNYKRETLPWSK